MLLLQFASTPSPKPNHDSIINVTLSEILMRMKLAVRAAANQTYDTSGEMRQFTHSL